MSQRRALLIVAIAILLFVVAPTVWVVTECRALMNATTNVDETIEREFQEEGLAALGLDREASYAAWDDMCRAAMVSRALHSAATATMLSGTIRRFHRYDELAPDEQAAHDDLIEVRLAAESERKPGDPYDDHELIDFERALAAVDSRPDIDAERDLLERMTTLDLVAEFDAAVRQVPFKRPTADGLSLEVDFVELADIRSLAKAIVADMCLLAEAGDLETAADRAETVLAAGHAMSWNPPLVRWLVGVSIQGLVTCEIRRHLDEHDLPEAVARRLLAAVERWSTAPLERGIEGERASMHYFLQQCFTDKGDGDGYMRPWKMSTLGGTGDGTPTFGTAFRARFSVPGRRAHRDAFDAAFDALLPVAAIPPSERAVAVEDLQLVGADAPITVQMMMPSIGKAARTADLVEFTTEYTRIMLALEVHHAVHGTWPATLDALAPAIVQTVPMDPTNGRSFVYRVTGEDYVLYGVGLDGVDDGGRFVEHDVPEMPLYDPGSSGYDVELRETRDAWVEW